MWGRVNLMSPSYVVVRLGWAFDSASMPLWCTSSGVLRDPPPPPPPPDRLVLAYCSGCGPRTAAANLKRLNTFEISKDLVRIRDTDSLKILMKISVEDRLMRSLWERSHTRISMKISMHEMVWIALRDSLRNNSWDISWQLSLLFDVCCFYLKKKA